MHSVSSIDPFTMNLPRKHIAELHEDVSRFRKSKGGQRVMSFISQVSDAIRGTAIGVKAESETCKQVVKLLEDLKLWIDLYPPIPQQQRFGNKAFRQWLDHVKAHAKEHLSSLVEEPLLSELFTYFSISFGEWSRIDYGTGHELSFAAFCCCLCDIGLIHDKLEIGLVLFPKYLEVMRNLQTIYWLEPAGSKGVWGLDDYQFLPFFWGASQLIDNPYQLTPNSIHDEALVDQFASEYLYFGAIQFIKRTKRGLFGEMAPLLNDISAVSNWVKVNQGLLRMYEAEVIAKFPVVQHFLFGSILPFEF